MTNSELIANAKLREKGFWFEDFEPGRNFNHHWGRTLTQAENALFVSLTMHFNPQYTNLEFAKAMNHRDTPVAPLLVFNTVFGLSVQDLSEHGTAFLGVDELMFHASVYPGDTILARSVVLDRRISSSNNKMGIVGWRTQGFNQAGDLVCSFKRSNLLFRRDLAEEDQS